MPVLIFTTYRTGTGTKKSDKMNENVKEESEVTVTIDIARFPRNYWSSTSEPFFRIDDVLLSNVYHWTAKQIPSLPCDVAVEFAGWAPAPVLAMVVKAVCDRNATEFYMHKPRSARCRVW